MTLCRSDMTRTFQTSTAADDRKNPKAETQTLGTAPTRMIARQETTFMMAIARPAPSHLLNRDAERLPTIPPAAPLSMKTPNRAGGSPSVLKRNSTIPAVAAEKQTPVNVLKNHSVRSILLAIMKWYPSTNWRYQRVRGTVVGVVNCLPDAAFGSSRARTTASA